MAIITVSIIAYFKILSNFSFLNFLFFLRQDSFLLEMCVAVKKPNLYFTIIVHACLDLTGFLMFCCRQPQITCACILNYVKHFYAAWIAWALTWRGSHTTRALIQLNFLFSFNKTPVITVSQRVIVRVA